MTQLSEVLATRESEKRTELEAQVAELRDRRTLVRSELATARKKLLDYDCEDSRRASSEAEAVLRAVNARLAELERELRRLNEFGDPEVRERFRQQLTAMCSEYTELVERNSKRVRQLGRTLGRKLAEGLELLRRMEESERLAIADIRSLHAVLEPTSSSAYTESSLGIVQFRGLDGLRREAREALRPEVARGELRDLLDFY